MTSERDKDATSSKSHSEGLRENEDETKLDLKSSDDLKGKRLDPREAKKLAAQISKTGESIPTGHLLQRLRERDMTLQDVINVLRRGIIEKEPKPNDRFGYHRYQIETPKMAVVFEFLTRTSLRLITAWRKT